MTSLHELLDAGASEGTIDLQLLSQSVDGDDFELQNTRAQHTTNIMLADGHE